MSGYICKCGTFTIGKCMNCYNTNWSFKTITVKDSRQSVYRCCMCGFRVTSEHIPYYNQRCFCSGQFRKICDFPLS